MRERQTRAWTVLAVVAALATLWLPPAGSLASSNQEKLKETNEKLEVVRERIDKLTGETDDLQSQIRGISREITGLQLEVNRLSAEIAKIESAVRTTQAKIDATQARIDKVKERATAQAVELYKSGSIDTLDALLESRSLAELDERVQFMGVAAQRNTSALISYGRLRLEIEDQNKELFRQKRDLDDTLASREAVLKAERELRASLSEKLGKLRGKLVENRRLEGNLEKESAAIKADIIAGQARAAVVSLGTSASGFIWPLNGRVTSPYGFRWGRMHSGIDIDGVTGQGIVASKGGTVILASYYSGYGNAVIVDHGGGIATLYAHMSSFAVSNGASVSQGQVVGSVGCTGSCTGDHLHFEVRVNGDPVDPMGYLP